MVHVLCSRVAEVSTEFEISRDYLQERNTFDMETRPSSFFQITFNPSWRCRLSCTLSFHLTTIVREAK